MKTAALALGITLAAVVLEVVLRLAPQVIHPRLLIQFEPGLRATIASGEYPIAKDYLPLDRDDGGPPMFVARPGSAIIAVDEPADGNERFHDEIGLCNPPGRYSGRERIDVIAVGDSFTWCQAVMPQQTWPVLLGDRTGLATFSLGRFGTGPYEYLQFLRAFGIAKRPRVVIMNIYGGNDVRDAVAYLDHRSAVARGANPPGDTPEPIAPALVRSVIGRHSYAVNLVLAFARWAATADTERDREKKGVDFRYDLLLDGGPVAFNLDNRDRDEIVSARHFDGGRTALAIWDAALERFVSLAREHGFLPIVSYTPSAHGAYRGRVRMADPSLEALLDRFGEAQRRFLAQRGSSLGFVFHDLTAALQEASGHSDAAGLLYDPVHVHLTVRGHEVVAASFADLLQQRGVGAD